MRTRQSLYRVALVHPESLHVAESKGHDINRAESERLNRLRKNARIVIPQAPSAGGICFFPNIFAKGRSLAALGMTPAKNAWLRFSLCVHTGFALDLPSVYPRTDA